MRTLPSKGSSKAIHPFRSIAPVRSGLFVPIFDQLADPTVVAGLAAEGEEARWDGFFVWDHVRWREPVLEVADAWITLAAIAAATQTIRLCPMVTPLARRRPVKVVGRPSDLVGRPGRGARAIFAGLPARTGANGRLPSSTDLLMDATHKLFPGR